MYHSLIYKAKLDGGAGHPGPVAGNLVHSRRLELDGCSSPSHSRILRFYGCIILHCKNESKETSRILSYLFTPLKTGGRNM